MTLWRAANKTDRTLSYQSENRGRSSIKSRMLLSLKGTWEHRLAPEGANRTPLPRFYPPSQTRQDSEADPHLFLEATRLIGQVGEPDNRCGKGICCRHRKGFDLITWAKPLSLEVQTHNRRPRSKDRNEGFSNKYPRLTQ